MATTAPMGWTLLVISLPSHSATPRMRVWRALKARGAAALRDGVYLLPAGPASDAVFREQAEEVRRSGGQARLLPIDGVDTAQGADFRGLFDRSGDYAGLIEAIRRLRAGFMPRTGKAATAQLRRLRRQFEAIRATDYFPGPAAEQAGELLAEAEGALEALASPGEPKPRGGAIRRLDAADFRGRTWATRKRPWVDRLASAWLIKRFIDPRARFLWLADAKKCPARALGFDFDGATFTHVGSRVTFEVLLASFGLENDPALVRIGALVHFLDVGGAPVPEASGVQAVLRGARERCKNDDALLAEARRLFDDLYHNYSLELSDG